MLSVTQPLAMPSTDDVGPSSVVAEVAAASRALEANSFCVEATVGKSSRINAKRKPDKSKIFRIRTSEPENITCRNCHYEALSTEDLENHEICCRSSSSNVEGSSRSPTPPDLRRHQDMANNNKGLKSPCPRDLVNASDGINGYESQPNSPDADSVSKIRNMLQQSSQSPIAQQLAQSNLALEAIQNTRMALAQLASNAIGNGQPTSPQAMQEMAVLQSTLYTLQHQHVMQLQLIQQLQVQLSINNKEKRNSDKLRHNDNKSDMEERSRNVSPPANINLGERSPLASNVPKSFLSNLMEKFNPLPVEEDVEKLNGAALPMPKLSNVLPESPALTASGMASAVIQNDEPPQLVETNALDMLQKTANDVLNNASKGLLTNRLIDDYSKPPEGKDSYYKHRCRYCGKVFGSDSALQIHVRSHTGERPFKCNICGNRFTTKGNLKVHFQRHSGRFPHIKMNPHPVPEHLDKFHPPLLAQLGELKDYPTAPTGPPNPFESSPIVPTLPSFRLTAPHPLAPIDLHSPFLTDDILKKSAHRVEADEEENIFSHMNMRSPNSPSPRTERPIEQMEIDESSNHSLELKQETGDEHLDNSDDEVPAMNSTLNEPSVLPDFHMPLREAIQNSLKERIPEHINESLRTTIQEHFREVARETLKDSINNSINKLSRERSPPQSKYLLDNSNDSDGESQSKMNSDSPCIEGEDAADKDDPVSQEIRIRTEQDLKESSERPSSSKENVEIDSNDSDSMNSDQPTDLRIRPDFRPMQLGGFPFPSQRMPLNFPMLPGLYPPFPVTSAPPTSNILPSKADPSKDPNVYANLLPRPGSNDNSWEALIEVENNTSETTKLEHLVNTIEHKLTDPNQCFVCHRVLSCKSALQMHYRTHTGERPFRCKICGRAFTTKGNLKTHMGVHRSKPPMRMLHQCPVCHKKYTNALVLQQHIRLHTGEPTDLSSEQIAAAEIRDFPPSLPPSLGHLQPGGFPLPPPMYGLPIPMNLPYKLSPDFLRRSEMDHDDRRDEEDKYLRPFSTSSRSSSDSNEQRIAEDLSIKLREEEAINGTSPRRSVSPTPSDYSDIGMDETSPQESSLHSMERIFGSQSSPNLPPDHLPFTSTPLDLAPRPAGPLFSPFGLFPPTVGSTPMNRAAPGLSNFNPLYMPNMPIAGGGYTTCSVCLKMFACQSALEIHYRSHTKERPFRCSQCDRKFSTKGNMKQHLMTHKAGHSQNDSDNNSCTGSSANEGSENVEPPMKTSDSSLDPTNGARSADIQHETEKVTDPGTKRERDGELTLPVPKRTTAIPEAEFNGDISRSSPAAAEVSKAKTEVSEALSNLMSFSSTNGTPLLPSLHTSNALPVPTTFPMPPSISLPVSLPMSSSLSLPHGLYPSSSVASAHPLSNS